MKLRFVPTLFERLAEMARQTLGKPELEPGVPWRLHRNLVPSLPSIDSLNHAQRRAQFRRERPGWLMDALLQQRGSPRTRTREVLNDDGRQG